MIICGRKQIKKVLERLSLSEETFFFVFLRQITARQSSHHADNFNSVLPWFSFPSFLSILARLLIKLSTFQRFIASWVFISDYFRPGRACMNHPYKFVENKHFSWQSADWFNDFYCFACFFCSHENDSKSNSFFRRITSEQIFWYHC